MAVPDLSFSLLDLQSLLRHVSSLIAICRIFSCGRQSLRWGMWDLVPWLGLEPGPPELGACNLSHWTTKEVPWILLYGKGELKLQRRRKWDEEIKVRWDEESKRKREDELAKWSQSWTRQSDGTTKGKLKEGRGKSSGHREQLPQGYDCSLCPWGPIYSAGREFLQLRTFWGLRGSTHPHIRHQALTTVLVSVCCPIKMPKTGWLLTVLEAGSLRSECQRSFHWGFSCGGLHFAVSSQDLIIVWARGRVGESILWSLSS